MLALRQNSLAGTIPESFFDELINITFVDLGQNHLSGSIPSTIGKVRNLRSVSLDDNSLSGRGSTTGRIRRSTDASRGGRERLRAHRHGLVFIRRSY